MTALCEISKPRDVEEHVYIETLPGTSSGNSELQPVTSTGNSEVKGDNSRKAFRLVVLVLSINSVFILALVVITAYMFLLQRPKSNVFCQKDQSCQEYQSFGAELVRITTAEMRLTTEVTRLTIAETKLTAEVTRLTTEKTSLTTEVTRLTTEVTTLMNAMASAEDNITTFRTARAVGFSARHPVPSLLADQMKFSTVITNEGDAYNSSTGVFTCPVAGTYYISVNLLKQYNYDGQAGCHVNKNDAWLVRAYTQLGHYSKTGSYAAVSAAYTRLTVGDTVTLVNCYTPIRNVFDVGSSFSVFLVTPDWD